MPHAPLLTLHLPRVLVLGGGTLHAAQRDVVHCLIVIEIVILLNIELLLNILDRLGHVVSFASELVPLHLDQHFLLHGRLVLESELLVLILVVVMQIFERVDILVQHFLLLQNSLVLLLVVGLLPLELVPGGSSLICDRIGLF